MDRLGFPILFVNNKNLPLTIAFKRGRLGAKYDHLVELLGVGGGGGGGKEGGRR